MSTSLPIPEQAFAGVIHELETDSTPARPAIQAPPPGAPNVVIVMLDDVGFGAASTFGGPIPTPALDRVAAGGVRYNQFHTTALCSPTRAALLTGRNHHTAHMGGIAEIAYGFPGYDGVDPAQHGDHRRGPAPERLQHRHVRQGARDAALGDERRRAPSTAGRPASASSGSTASWAARPPSGSRRSTTRRRPSSRMSVATTTT